MTSSGAIMVVQARDGKNLGQGNDSTEKKKQIVGI